MATLGIDCDVILTHASVNGGVGVGFLLVPNPASHQQVEIKRWAFTDLTGQYLEQYIITCRLYLLEGALQPDGSAHMSSRAADYALLLSFLGQNTGVQFATHIGTFTELHASLQMTEEHHFQSHSEIVLMLNNGNFDELLPSINLDFLGMWDFSDLQQSGEYLTVGF